MDLLRETAATLSGLDRGDDEPLLRAEAGSDWDAPPPLRDVEGQATSEARAREWAAAARELRLPRVRVRLLLRPTRVPTPLVPPPLVAQCDVESLLASHAHVLRYVQQKGVARLGEFQEQDSLVFAAFTHDTLLTMGSDVRDDDFECAWRARLRELAGRQPAAAPHHPHANQVVVEAFVVTIKGAALPGKRGLLQPLLRRYQAGLSSHGFVSLPAVQAVIKLKWHSYARRLLLVQLAVFLVRRGGGGVGGPGARAWMHARMHVPTAPPQVWLLSFYAFVILFQVRWTFTLVCAPACNRAHAHTQDEDLSSSLSELVREPKGRATVAAEVVAVAAMVPFVLLDVSTLPAYGLAGWLDLWTSASLLTYAIQVWAVARAFVPGQPISCTAAPPCPLPILPPWSVVAAQIGATALHLSRTGDWIRSDWLTALLAAQCLILTLRLQYYTQVFRGSRFAFLSISERGLDVRGRAGEGSGHAAGTHAPPPPTPSERRVGGRAPLRLFQRHAAVGLCPGVLYHVPQGTESGWAGGRAGVCTSAAPGHDTRCRCCSCCRTPPTHTHALSGARGVQLPGHFDVVDD